jgi:transcriptional regulator with XRE-family HTH domain
LERDDYRVTGSDQGFGSGSASDVRPLRDVRADRLLSMRELAQLAGVAPSTIYLIEVGRTTPRLSVIRRLSEALAIDPQEVTEFRRAIRAHADSR